MLAAPVAALALTLGAVTGGPPVLDATVVVEVRTPSPATGTFVAEVDFASLALRPILGGCELTVSGQLVFDTGTLDGVAPGTTTAVVLAPCSQVAAAPPGAYPDVFRFEGRFDGTVDGVPASGELTYAGITAIGGSIDAVITLDGGPSAVLRATAEVARGGSYTGVAVT